jgi:release factor glutamine methyltransferase
MALNVKQALCAARGRIPALDAHVLLAHVLGCARADLIARPERELSPAQGAAFMALVERAADDVPVAYLLGRRAWYDMDLEVAPAVLVPRPETELLLERALAFLAQRGGQAVVVDVGTGSGALAVGVKRHHPHAAVHAVDISAEALAVAQRNAARWAPGVIFHHGDLLTPLLGREPFDLIMANLPYIPTETARRLPVAKHEPLLALDGGADGLALIRRLLAQIANGRMARAGGLILLEIGADQGEACAELARRHLPGGAVRVLTDYAGLDRIVEVRIEV